MKDRISKLKMKDFDQKTKDLLKKLIKKPSEINEEDEED